MHFVLLVSMEVDGCMLVGSKDVGRDPFFDVVEIKRTMVVRLAISCVSDKMVVALLDDFIN